MSCHQIRRPEPQAKRGPRSMHHRAGRHRRLQATRPTHPQVPTRLGAHATAAAPGTREPVRPTAREQIGAACVLGRELLLQGSSEGIRAGTPRQATFGTEWSEPDMQERGYRAFERGRRGAASSRARRLSIAPQSLRFTPRLRRARAPPAPPQASRVARNALARGERAVGPEEALEDRGCALRMVAGAWRLQLHRERPQPSCVNGRLRVLRNLRTILSSRSRDGCAPRGDDGARLIVRGDANQQIAAAITAWPVRHPIGAPASAGTGE